MRIGLKVFALVSVLAAFGIMIANIFAPDISHQFLGAAHVIAWALFGVIFAVLAIGEK